MDYETRREHDLDVRRRDSHAIGARAFKEKRTPEWPNHGL